MTDHTGGGEPLLATALRLAAASVPVLPLRAGKVPFGNCHTCRSCDGRPNMKHPGTCACLDVCHGWAAATTNPRLLTSPLWVAAWRRAVALAYHPGGAGLTVVDLDNAAAVAWARAGLPATRTVVTTRGEHWIYRGVMSSANAVRPGVDIKSCMAYARWLGPGHGAITVLSDVVRRLAVRQETTLPAGGVVSSPGWDRSVAAGCRHTDTYIRAGLARGVAKIRAHTETGAASQAFGVARFLAGQHTHCPGPCGLDQLAAHITDAAVAVGVPHAYAQRAVTNGLNAQDQHV